MLPLLLVAGFAVAALAGCGKKQEYQPIKLPPTPLLGVQQSWAVVNSALLRLRQQPSTTAKALITLRGGYVVEVVRRSDRPETIGDHDSYWYYINFRGLRGWVYGYYLTMYDSRQRAEQAAQEFK